MSELLTTVVVPVVGIAVPAAILTAVVRRWVEQVPWGVAGLLLVLAIAGLGPAGVTPDLPIPLDAACSGAPFEGVVEPGDLGNPLTSETARLFLAWHMLGRDALLSAEAPLYNPHAFAGMPLLGNGQAVALSPVFLATLPVPLPEQVEAMAGLKLFAALLFAYLLARREGVGAPAAVAGAAVYGLGLFHAVFLHYSVTAVSALAPAVLLFAGRVASGGRRADRVGLILATAATMLGGHPETVVHIALAAIASLVLEGIAPAAGDRPRWTSAVPAVAVAVALGTAIGAPAWLPFAEQALESERLASVDRTGHDATPALPAEGAALLVDPERYGHPADDDWSFVSNFAEVASAYVGLLPLALLAVPLLSPAAKRRDRWLLAAVVLAWLVAFRWTPVGDLLNRLPLLEWTANARLRFVAALGVALLTARTLDRFDRRDRLPAVAGTAAVVAAAFGLATFGDRAAPVHLLVAIAALAVFWSVTAVARGRLAPAGLAVPLIAADLLTIGAPFNAPVDRALYVPELPIVKALRRDAGDDEPFRAVGLRWVMLPQTSTWYGLEDVRGADPMGNRRYLEVLDLAVRRDNPHGAHLVLRMPHPVLDMLGVRYALAAPDERPQLGLERVYSGPDGFLYRNPRALPRFFVPGHVVAAEATLFRRQLRAIRSFARLTLVDEATGATVPVENGTVRELEAERLGVGRWRLDVEAATPAVVASSLPDVPGWRVRVDGERAPVVRVNHAFVGFRVPAGGSVVELRYRPWTFDLGLLLAAAGLGGLLLWTRRRPTPAILTP